MELNELSRFGLHKFVVNEVWGVLNILNLFVSGRVVRGIEC
jgi:hypothetical protein